MGREVARNRSKFDPLFSCLSRRRPSRDCKLQSPALGTSALSKCAATCGKKPYRGFLAGGLFCHCYDVCDHGHTVNGNAANTASFTVTFGGNGTFATEPRASCRPVVCSQLLVVPSTLPSSNLCGDRYFRVRQLIASAHLQTCRELTG